MTSAKRSSPKVRGKPYLFHEPAEFPEFKKCYNSEMELKEKIKSFFKGDVEDDEAVLRAYSRDASLFEIKPELVVFPKDADDIKNLVKFVNNYGEKKLSLAPRSGGTDMSGGPLTDSIVVEFDRYFDRIKEVGRDF